MYARPDTCTLPLHSRRQQVLPDPNPSSRGSIAQRIPVLRTKMMPARICRLGRRGRPRRAVGRRSRRGRVRARARRELDDQAPREATGGGDGEWEGPVLTPLRSVPTSWPSTPAFRRSTSTLKPLCSPTFEDQTRIMLIRRGELQLKEPSELQAATDLTRPFPD